MKHAQCLIGSLQRPLLCQKIKVNFISYVMIWQKKMRDRYEETKKKVKEWYVEGEVIRGGHDCKKEWHSERLSDDGKIRLTRKGLWRGEGKRQFKSPLFKNSEEKQVYREKMGCFYSFAICGAKSQSKAKARRFLKIKFY